MAARGRRCTQCLKVVETPCCEYDTGYTWLHCRHRPKTPYATTVGRKSLISDNTPTAAKHTDATEVGMKHDGKKVDLSLLVYLPMPALHHIAQAFEFGAKKYSADNWRGGISYRRVGAAALRHIFSWLRGEDTDPESGLSHLAHAGACVLFALTYTQTKPEFDDRIRCHDDLVAPSEPWEK